MINSSLSGWPTTIQVELRVLVDRSLAAEETHDDGRLQSGFFSLCVLFQQNQFCCDRSKMFEVQRSTFHGRALELVAFVLYSRLLVFMPFVLKT